MLSGDPDDPQTTAQAWLGLCLLLGLATVLALLVLTGD
jgi:hypothetical protein